MERRCSARLSGASEPRCAEGPRPAARPPDAAAAAALRRARAAERAREVEDSPRVLRDKCRRLARALRNAKHLVVYTGAGISTAADIPDYRGPRGVWTRLQRGEAVGRVEVSRATPTFTHMALTALWARGALKFVVSQNCDGLHLRSGLPRRALAELHGDMFAERCAACRRVYLRAFDTTERTARHAHGTRRLCHSCGLELRDTIVHFGERGRAAWPLNWAGALRHAAAADVILCLGSSLKVLRRYPRLWCMQRAPRDRPALYIVNLQWTPKDAVAALKINARCDTVMAEVARRLRLRVPRYRPSRDPLLAHATPLAPPEAHTTRRPLLRAPSNSASDESDADLTSEPTSPSASDSDEELPLRRLADRLRDDHTTLPANGFRSFRVCMQTGEATILLRSEHAPSVLPPPPEPPPAVTSPRRSLSDLRRFRMPKRSLVPTASDSSGATVNGDAGGATFQHAYHDDRKVLFPKSEKDTKKDMEVANGQSKQWRLLGYEPCLETIEPNSTAIEYTAKSQFKLEPKQEAKTEMKLEIKQEESNSHSSEEDSGAALAAAIIRRAVLVCRASLYSGLHTIIAPPGMASAAAAPATSPAAGECAWCARRFAARRCLWYPPAATTLSARTWQRVRGRRQLCACCGERDVPLTAAPADALEDSGWYGKGYRKGRRRRR